MLAAAQKENASKKAKIVFLKSAIEATQEVNKAAEAAAKSFADYKASVAGERAAILAENKETKADLEKQKADIADEINAAKNKFVNAGNAYVSLKNKTISLEADLAGRKGELKAIAEAIALTDRKATAALREKRELWQTITGLQSQVNTAAARFNYLERQGYEVDQTGAGTLCKLHYKLHAYINYKLARGRK